jgi:hypothetical protein
MKNAVISVFFACSTVFAADVADVKVKALDGFGGDVGAVLKRCQTKVGAPYDPVTVTRDVTALKESGLFDELYETYFMTETEETAAE